jgi:hypothetical protein
VIPSGRSSHAACRSRSSSVRSFGSPTGSRNAGLSQPPGSAQQPLATTPSERISAHESELALVLHGVRGVFEVALPLLTFGVPLCRARRELGPHGVELKVSDRRAHGPADPEQHQGQSNGADGRPERVHV